MGIQIDVYRRQAKPSPSPGCLPPLPACLCLPACLPENHISNFQKYFYFFFALAFYYLILVRYKVQCRRGEGRREEGEKDIYHSSMTLLKDVQHRSVETISAEDNATFKKKNLHFCSV
jgi:hypothetical protein